jgi:hypothetical protein
MPEPTTTNPIRAQAIAQMEAGLNERFESLKELMSGLRAF